MKAEKKLKILTCLLGGALAANAAGWLCVAKLWRAIEKRDEARYAANAKIELLKMWIRAGGDKNALEEYLLSRGVNTIAIYGYNDIGDLIWRCLRNSRIKVAYAIDANGNNKQCWLNVYRLEDEFPQVDMVIVAPIRNVEKEKAILKEKLSCEVLEIAQMVHDFS